MAVQWMISDAWVFAAIEGTGPDDSSTLAEIIAKADAINHAILTDAEFTQAVGRLVTVGLIGARGDADRYWHTEAGRVLYRDAMKRRGLFGWIDAIPPALRRFGEPKESVGSLPAGAFDRAVEQYSHWQHTNKMRPSCGGLAIRLTGNPEPGALYELSAKAGTEVAIEAEAIETAGDTLLEGSLLVGRPGTVLGRPANAGRPNPPNAITLPQNQVARQRLIQGEPVTLRFTPTSPGDYPVTFEARVQTKGYGCRPMTGVGQLAVVHVTR